MRVWCGVVWCGVAWRGVACEYLDCQVVDRINQGSNPRTPISINVQRHPSNSINKSLEMNKVENCWILINLRVPSARFI